MIVAYLRVSKAKERFERQQYDINRFLSAKILSVDEWIMEELADDTSGDSSRKLNDALERMGEGDTLIVSDIYRLNKALSEVMCILSTCLGKKISLYCVNDHYVFDDSLNRKAMSFAFRYVVDMEHNLMSVRTKEALAHRRVNGARLGRPKGSDSKQSYLEENKEKLLSMLSQGLSVVSICKHFRVSRNTYYQFKRNYGL